MRTTGDISKDPLKGTPFHTIPPIKIWYVYFAYFGIIRAGVGLTGIWITEVLVFHKSILTSHLMTAFQQLNILLQSSYQHVQMS